SGNTVRAGPSAATVTASAASAAADPTSAERQSRVIPMATTMVSASTISTPLARKEAATRNTALMPGSYRCGWPGGQQCVAVTLAVPIRPSTRRAMDKQEVLDRCRRDNVAFIRLQLTEPYGSVKNVTIPFKELANA